MKVLSILGTEKGAFLLRSDGARKDWTLQGPLFKGWKATCSSRGPDGRWFVGTASFVYGAAIHTSEDLANWTQIERGPAYAEGGIHKLNQIWTLHTEGERYYAGVDTAGLFASEDRGQSWQPVSALNDHPTRESWFPGNGGLCAHAVLVDPKDAQRVWCGISAVGVWRSDDGGATWSSKNDGIKQVIEDKQHEEIGYCVHGLAADPDDADTIYRQDHTGMYRTRDGGDSWQKIEEGLGGWFGFPIAIDQRTKTLYAVPLESDEYRMPKEGRLRVFRSRNGGDAWEPLERGLPEAPTYVGVLRGALVADSLDPCGIYIGDTSGRVHISADGGDSWQTLPFTLPRILNVRTYVED